MAAEEKENLQNFGIFARLFDDGTFEVLWLDGHGVVTKALDEESTSGAAITRYLNHNGTEVLREMYSPHGEFEGYANLRKITLHESVHYLSRVAKICAFLRPKGQAVRFIQGLRKSKERTEHELATKIEKLLPKFGSDPLEPSKSGIYRMMESGLFNLITDTK